MARVPTVVHIPYDRAVRGHYRARSGGGNSQEEHHLTAQELSDTGAQHLTAISLPTEDRIDRSYVSLSVHIVVFDNQYLCCFKTLQSL